MRFSTEVSMVARSSIVVLLPVEKAEGLGLAHPAVRRRPLPVEPHGIADEPHGSQLVCEQHALAVERVEQYRVLNRRLAQRADGRGETRHLATVDGREAAADLRRPA